MVARSPRVRLAAPSPRREVETHEGLAEPSRESDAQTDAPAATQDNSPSPAAPAATVQVSPWPQPPPAAIAEPQRESPPSAGPAPLFRARADLGKTQGAPIPAVIPILRAPDDPGIDDDAPRDEFVEQIGTSKAQAGGWRGFLARWGGS